MSRIESVDTFKLLAITAIIVIHTTPYSNMPLNEEWYNHIGVFLNQISRFAVPYFFIISGYFYGAKINSGHEIKTLSIKILRKLFIIFVAWSFIYSLPHDISHIYNFGFLGAVQIAYFELMTRISDPITLIFQGTKVHLWFLVGIGFAVAISAIFLQLGLKKSLIIFAVILYIFGLLAKAYVDSPFWDRN